MSRILYEAARPILAALLHLVCRYRINNRPSALPEGPIIVASNHLCWLDIPLIGVAFPGRVSFMAKEEYARSWFHRWIIRLFGSFTVERGTIDRSALKAAEQALHRGYALGIFPEGTRSKSFQLIPAGPGTAYVALRNNAYILPVGISGTENIRQRYERKRFMYRPDVVINIGEPFKLPAVDGKPSRQQLASYTETIMRSLAALLPESYRGAYGDGAIASGETADDNAH